MNFNSVPFDRNALRYRFCHKIHSGKSFVDRKMKSTKAPLPLFTFCILKILDRTMYLYMVLQKGRFKYVPSLNHKYIPSIYIVKTIVTHTHHLITHNIEKTHKWAKWIYHPGFGWKFEFGFLFYRIATLKRVVRLHCAQCLEFDWMICDIVEGKFYKMGEMSCGGAFIFSCTCAVMKNLVNFLYYCNVNVSYR